MGLSGSPRSGGDEVWGSQPPLEFELDPERRERLEPFLDGLAGPLLEPQRVDVLVPIDVDDVEEGDQAESSETAPVVESEVQRVKRRKGKR